MGITDTETFLREQLLDKYLDALVERADPDNIEDARNVIEADFIDALTKAEIFTQSTALFNGAAIVYNPAYGDFVIENPHEDG